MKIDGRCHCGHIAYEAEIDPDGTELGGQEPADRMRATQPLLPILIETTTDEARGGQRRKAFAEALHAAALVIGGDQQMRRTESANGCAQLSNLLWIPIVTSIK